MASADNLSSGARVTSTLVKFWNDDVAELYTGKLRRQIPTMPKITVQLQTVVGPIPVLCYLALQIKKTNEKSVVMRALASAASILFKQTSKNMLGCSNNPVQLTGLDALTDESIEDRTSLLTTNFEGAEDVTLNEMDDLMNVDVDELGSYFGVLFLAGVKSLNDKNRTAFNEKRQSAAQSTAVGELRIFVTDSAFLSDVVLKKVYAAFNSYLPLRTMMISNIVMELDKTLMGPTLSFVTMFLLLADQGMSALRIVKEALVKHRWIYDEFPEIHPELQAAQEGVRSIQSAQPRDRSFLKAMHGSSYVPVSYQSIANLTGLCKFVLKETTTTYEQYDGGKVTEAQEIKLIKLMTERGLMRGVAETSTVVSKE